MTSEQTPVVRLQVSERIGFVTIDNPPVNATSQSVRQGLRDVIARALEDAAVDAVVLSCAGKTFVSGGDIREFGEVPREPHLPDVLNVVEASSKPIVAAINGTALGGGLELALACHARILDKDAKLGLPEVKLGLIPGAGGTQRLPRLIGMQPAIEIVATGRLTDADEALKLGLADAIARDDLRQEAKALALSLIGRPLRRTSQLAVRPFEAQAIAAASSAITKKARGQIAPIKAVEAVSAAAALPFSEGVKREREMFLELKAGPQSKALRHAFFAEREVHRLPRLESASRSKIETVGVIGAGTMGAGIAVALADAGLSVTVVETTAAGAQAGHDRVAALYDRQIKSGRITANQGAARKARMSFAAGFDALAPSDLVIEAVFEDMATKEDIFRRLGSMMKPGAILATNTSYLDIDQIARASGRPRDVVGLHFFAPANVMRLLEVVEAAETSIDVVATGVELGRRLGKVPVVSGVCDGFIGNRILAAYRQHAEFALEDGALPRDVDAALETFGFPMGPFAVADLSGLDISWARRKRLALTRDSSMRYASTIADRLCAMGHFGQKTGAGWYRYVDGRRETDPEVTQLVETVAAEFGIKRRPINADTICARVRAAIVNEGARILEEGIAARSLDIDMVMIHGYGYPAWRGGPMFEADALGLSAVLEDVKAMCAAGGTGWQPANLLVDLAAKNQTFAEFSAASSRNLKS